MSIPTLAPELLPPGQTRFLPQLHGSADSWIFAELARRLTVEERTLCVLCADPVTAHRLVDELRWLCPELTIDALPDWETLPYDHFSPHQDIVSERLATLFRLSQGGCNVLVAPATTASFRLAPKSHHAAYTFVLDAKQKLNVPALREQLVTAGYAHVTQVAAAGEFSVRGGLIDLYPMGATLPYRLDLFDDEIESIKTFDVDSQRTLYPVPNIRLLPAREFPLDEPGRLMFRQRFRELFEGDPSKCSLYKDVGNGIVPGGIEYFLPLFFKETATLFDYLPADAVVVQSGDLSDALTRFGTEAEGRYKLLRGDPARPLLPPEQLFVPHDDFLRSLKAYSRVAVNVDKAEARLSEPAPRVEVDRRAEAPLRLFAEFLQSTPCKVIVCAESAGRRETLLESFLEHGLRLHPCDSLAAALASDARATLIQSPLQHGFVLPAANLVVITEAELYTGTVRRSSRKAQAKSQVENMLRDLSEVKPGDPVVHEQHGIGRYRGLISLDLGDGASEFLEVEYANASKLYVPVGSMHLISRYSGTDPEAAPLHNLGTEQWEKARRKAAMQARDTAAELLNIYAQRAARTGHAFQFSGSDYEQFCAGFQFEETADQSAAIQAVLQDLISPKPMDRLVCGDVGFGKTEVALRAAFIALMGGKQVAVLVPTTLLAEQHFNTFKDRLAQWPINVAELSRFRTTKEINAALEGLAKGSIDLIIGTHKLIQPTVKFARLGLVIIDEEHRFGVRQKEQMKKLRAEVDILTLTATPIPRTLAMSMEGLRDFSVIATAPQKRLAIKTFVTNFSEGIIREACLRELNRGGQIYFLHNEIDTIENMRERLVRLMPEARIRVGHGQMNERELEDVMRDFYHQRFQILLCSTIIETGIDVASANTILINRADRFGLAQLHQLRGRVGRSHHQAFAYLLTPPDDALSQNAKRRLEAIGMMEQLGSGFFLAMHDLEIRGAGEVLGDKQSGEMLQVGFQLYTDMLNHAVQALKAGREPDMNEPLGITTEVNLHTPALLPDDYCPDVHERLVIYKRLANCVDPAHLTAMKEELIDRFGPLPEQSEALVTAHEIRMLAKPLGITKVDSALERSVIHFAKQPNFEPIKLIHLVQKDGRYRFAGPDKLRIERASPSLREQTAQVKEFLRNLAR